MITRACQLILCGFISTFIGFGCQDNEPERPVIRDYQPEDTNEKKEGIDYFLPDIDLSNWKVTLPISRESDNRPLEVKPPQILDYAKNEQVIPFMYNDSTDGSLVFFTYPDASTANSKYSRTELREQMEPGNNSVNWTLPQGGHMRGKLSVPEISKDENGNFHRTAVMQIHGILTDTQRDLIGQKDNNAPPILLIFWTDGKIRVKSKTLKNIEATGKDLLYTDAWESDKGKTFSQEVGHSSFILDIKASQGLLKVSLNDEETFIYEGVHMDKWGVFENYFKAGNYLLTKDKEAFAKVKYYELKVDH